MEGIWTNQHGTRFVVGEGESWKIPLTLLSLKSVWWHKAYLDSEKFERKKLELYKPMGRN